LGDIVVDENSKTQCQKCIKKEKKNYKRERRKTLVTLWLTIVINHNITQMLSVI